ncbi:zinc cluster transcription factor [Salix suchowensis]|nr:zinc cluster transcription factor [Salix suchowensis]
MAGFTYLISLYEIAGRVLREVYALENCKEHLEPEQKANLQKLVESLDNELTKWCDELPAVFKSQSETDEQVSMGAVLCSHYYSVLTTLHRNFLPVKRDQPVTPKSTVKAVSSARSCIRLAPSMRDVVPPSHHLAFFIQHLFSSAVILLLYAMHATDPRAATAAMEEARTTLTAMEQWEGQWPGARKCKELLIELANTASEAIANGPRDINEGPSQTTSPTLVERRRSVTISTPAIQASGSRPVKGRPNRRTQSRDASSARRAAVSPYRVDSAQRARSTSRKRGIDEAEPVERASLASYYQTFSSPTLNPARTNTNISPHSSPSSVNLPSPSMTVERSQEASPRLTNAQTYTTAVSPVQVTSPSTSFNYDFNMHPAPLTQMQSQPWPSTSDNRGPNLFPPVPMMPTCPTTVSTRTLPVRFVVPKLRTLNRHGNLGALSTTPPSASFAAPGLPFPGLEYIRNYRSNGYSLSGEQDSLWHSYDPGAFGLDPDLPFTPFGDLNNDTSNQEGHR